MPRGSQRYSKGLLFILLLIFLAFLPSSDELSFGWGGGGGDDDSKAKDVSADASALRKVNKKHSLQKKFKFHKIERIETEEDDNEDDGEDGDGDDDTNENHAGEEIDDNATNERADDDLNGDDEEEEENDSQHDRAASLNSENNDDEEVEFQFKKARKAEKKMTHKLSEETTSKEKSKSFFSNIFGGLFSDENDEKEKTSRESVERQSKEDTKSNGIIDWLMWLGEKTGRLREATTESEEENTSAAESSIESWLDYFNRWPFNSLFPIGKPPKPISMPKSSSTKSSRKRATSAAAGDEASHEETMSQESFDTLIRTLPNFVLNPSEISNTECRQQMQIFERQLRGHKLWTLQSKSKSNLHSIKLFFVYILKKIY